mgnify:CR=1 FL=1
MVIVRAHVGPSSRLGRDPAILWLIQVSPSTTKTARRWAGNDNWQDDPNVLEIEQNQIAPKTNRESATILHLHPRRLPGGRPRRGRRNGDRSLRSTTWSNLRSHPIDPGTTRDSKRHVDVLSTIL